MKLSFVTVTIFFGNFDELIAIRGPSIFPVSLTLEKVLFLEEKQIVDLAFDNSCVAAMDAIHIFLMYPFE